MFDFKGKKILVTGGAGFIGSHIVERLLGLDAEVIVVDDLTAGSLENLGSNLERIKFIEADFSDPAVLDSALEGVDFISHQAALRSVPKSLERPLDYHRVNVTGTLKLFLKAKEAGIKRIVFASSSSIYGERSKFPEREIDKPQPVSPYAATKLLGETYAYLFSKIYNLEVVSLRYFNVFGPRQSLENQYAVVVPKFITCLLAAKQPPIHGDGNQERDFTYIDNVVDANLLALVKENIAGEVFNIASGRPYSVNYLLKRLQRISGKNIAPVHLELRPGDIRKTQADINKAKKLLGYKPKVNFNQGLDKTMAWFEKEL